MERSPHPIDTVLVATDFSETARTGLDWALDIARKHGARIHLVHALLLPGQMSDYVPSPPDLGARLQEAATERLEEVAAAVRTAGIEVSSEVRLGLASEAIVEAAREQRPRLIVAGTRGLTGIKHLLLGSTAERVVQRAECPVLTVHPADAARRRAVRTILVPTDFSRDAELAAHTALDLLCRRRAHGAPEPRPGRSEDGARLVLLHAYHYPFEYTVYGTVPTSPSYLEDAGAVAEDNLEAAAEPLRCEGLTVETAAREGYPPDIIVSEAEARAVDLIAMGTHGRTGLAHLVLGSTAERVVQHAGCPVLTVRYRGA